MVSRMTLARSIGNNIDESRITVKDLSEDSDRGIQILKARTTDKGTLSLYKRKIQSSPHISLFIK